MKPKALKPQIMWFIGGMWSNGYPFLYCGGHLRRIDAIRAHEAAGGRTWAECQRAGDYAVKCAVTPLRPAIGKKS